MTTNVELLTLLEVGTAELANVEPRISDEELKVGPYFFVIMGFSRKPAEKGAQIAKPFESWLGFGEVNGRWIKRELAARSHVNKLLMSQVHYHKLAFHDLSKRMDEPGGVIGTPGAEGVFRFVDREKGEPCALLALVSIDKTKGKAAGTGRAFIYNVNAAVKTFAHVAAKLPQLPMSEGSVLAIAAESDDDEDGAGLAPPIDASAEPVETETADTKGKPAKKRR